MPDFQSSPGSVKNHRGREKGLLIYPVYSRRSGGLSLGINLFPDRKTCNFDCPYCEVFPFAAKAVFSLEQMKADLRAAIDHSLQQTIPVKDICFSGNGEPSLSADFPAALEAAGAIRAELVPDVELVLITNAAGLLYLPVFETLTTAAAGPLALTIWLKLDAGTPGWYHKMNRSAVPFEELTGKIKDFAARAPFTLQTMLCAVDGTAPPPDEAASWERLITDLAAIGKAAGAGIGKVRIYGKARAAPEDPKAEALPPEYLEARAASLRRALAVSGSTAIQVEVYP